MLTWPKAAFRTALLQHFQHQTLEPCGLRGVCAESVGKNTGEANGFALTWSSFAESMGVEGKRTALALWNILRLM